MSRPHHPEHFFDAMTHVHTSEDTHRKQSQQRDRRIEPVLDKLHSGRRHRHRDEHDCIFSSFGCVCLCLHPHLRLGDEEG